MNKTVSLVSVVMLAAGVLGGCGGDDKPSSAGTTKQQPVPSAPAKKTEPAQPKTSAAVRKVAQEEFDSFSSGDYGGAWDLWSEASKRLISRADYTKLFELCPSPVEGLRFTIKDVKVAGNDAVVRAERSIALLSFWFRYEGGQWRYLPDESAVKDYRVAREQGVDKLAAHKRGEGLCGT